MSATMGTDTKTSTAPATTAAEPQARLSIADLVRDYTDNKLHGKDVNAYLVERFMPLIDKAKGLAKIRYMILLHLIAEAFPKHVWGAIAESGDPAEIAKRVRTAVRAMQKTKGNILASLTESVGTDLDLLYLAVDERQNLPGKMGGAEWSAFFLNVTPDKKTQTQIAVCQLDPSRAKQVMAETPAKK